MGSAPSMCDPRFSTEAYACTVREPLARATTAKSSTKDYENIHDSYTPLSLLFLLRNSLLSAPPSLSMYSGFQCTFYIYTSHIVVSGALARYEICTSHCSSTFSPSCSPSLAFGRWCLYYYYAAFPRLCPDCYTLA